MQAYYNLCLKMRNERSCGHYKIKKPHHKIKVNLQNISRLAIVSSLHQIIKSGTSSKFFESWQSWSSFKIRCNKLNPRLPFHHDFIRCQIQTRPVNLSREFVHKPRCVGGSNRENRRTILVLPDAIKQSDPKAGHSQHIAIDGKFHRGKQVGLVAEGDVGAVAVGDDPERDCKFIVHNLSAIQNFITWSSSTICSMLSSSSKRSSSTFFVLDAFSIFLTA